MKPPYPHPVIAREGWPFLGIGIAVSVLVVYFCSWWWSLPFWGFVVFLAAVQVYANFGPPPSSPEAMAVTVLAFYVVLASLAEWVERIATVSTEAKPAH